VEYHGEPGTEKPIRNLIFNPSTSLEDDPIKQVVKSDLMNVGERQNNELKTSDYGCAGAYWKPTFS
jgi:hypothetical protein